MISPQDIRDLQTAAAAYAETERLKEELRSLRAQRNPLFLSAKDLEPIFQWKLDTQYGRNKHLRDANTDDAYKTVTRAAFAILETDAEYEAELRLGILTSLRGIGVPVASAILALAEPDRYCVTDFRGWRAVFGEDRKSFTIPHYKKYRGEIHGLAVQLGWRVQEVDLAVWEYDRRSSQSDEIVRARLRQRRRHPRL